MSDFHIVIPVRLASSRLPDKALADINGKPMVVRVLECARYSGAVSVHVATDSEQIAEVVRAAGHQVIMTGVDHDSGTSRLAEAVVKLGLNEEAIVVNLQGDEPQMPAACLNQVAKLLASDRQAAMATLWEPIDDPTQWQDPSVVKLVVDHHGKALYFSRAPIPFQRDRDGRIGPWRRHVGLYAYRCRALRAWRELPQSALEASERLEQLKALEAGWRIITAPARQPIPAGVDTEADLERVRNGWDRSDMAAVKAPGNK